MTLCVAFIDSDKVGHLIADSGAFPENIKQSPVRGYMKIMSANVVASEDCQTVGVAFAGNEGPLIQKIISSGLTVDRFQAQAFEDIKKSVGSFITRT